MRGPYGCALSCVVERGDARRCRWTTFRIGAASASGPALDRHGAGAALNPGDASTVSIDDRALCRSVQPSVTAVA